MPGITARCESVYDSIDIPERPCCGETSSLLASASMIKRATHASALPHKNEFARCQV